MQLKASLKINDVEKLEVGWRIYTVVKTRQKIGIDKFAEVDQATTIKSDVDLSRYVGKTVTCLFKEPFSPRDSSQIFYRIIGIENS